MKRRALRKLIQHDDYDGHRVFRGVLWVIVAVAAFAAVCWAAYGLWKLLP